MATTATRIVPDPKTMGQKPKRKPVSKAHKAKLAATLASRRASAARLRPIGPRWSVR
jgi:hypothetical protein